MDLTRLDLAVLVLVKREDRRKAIGGVEEDDEDEEEDEEEEEEDAERAKLTSLALSLSVALSVWLSSPGSCLVALWRGMSRSDSLSDDSWLRRAFIRKV